MVIGTVFEILASYHGVPRCAVLISLKSMFLTLMTDSKELGRTIESVGGSFVLHGTSF
jgi:ABC-type xylose transport system permease subunit